MSDKLFSLGQILATPGVLAAMERAEANPVEYLQRHVTGDWGDLCEEDQAENEYSLNRHLRIWAACNLPDDTRDVDDHGSGPKRNDVSIA